jgi:hypothetical protein
MTKAYQSGHNKKGTVNINTAGGYVELDVTDQQFDEMTQLHILQNASLGTRTGRIGGFGDASGTVTCDFDGLNSPYLTGANKFNLVSGMVGIYRAYINDNGGNPTYWTFPIIVEKVHYSVPGNNKVTFSFDWKENCLVGTTTAPSV